MAKKKEDNRDVFEKAFDDVMPSAAAAGSAILGGVAGGKLGGAIGRRMKASKRSGPKWDAAVKASDDFADGKISMRERDRIWTDYNRSVSAAPHAAIGAAIGGASAGSAGYAVADSKRKRRK